MVIIKGGVSIVFQKYPMTMKKIKWGFLSTARIGASAYVPAIRNSRNGELYAVASRDLGKAQAFAKEHGFACAYGSYEELLADPQVDAVYISLPNSMHCEWSIKAAEAGKPVLCEKPLAANADEARRMRDSFGARNLPLQEAFMYRHHPLNQRAAELCKSGRIGKILTIRSVFTSDSRKDGDIRMSKELAGGALRDLGCYCVSIARFVTREEPKSVKALAINYSDDGVDTQISGCLKFPSGIIASFSCGFGSLFTCGYEIFGSEGRILCELGAMVAWPSGQFHLKVWSNGRYEEIPIAPANHYQLIAEHFGDAVLLGQPLIFPADDAVKGMAVLDRLCASAAE